MTHIETGEIRLTINDDPARVIVFNPQDVLFSEKFYSLVGDFNTRLAEFDAREKALLADARKDANGLPLNFLQLTALHKECDAYMREKIDYAFGEGTAQTAFGNTVNINMFGSFFNAIKPYFEKARTEKVEQYTTPESAKRNKRKG